MIRFVDLRYQGVGARFSFWQTVTNSFYSLQDSQAWGEWDSFLEDLSFEHEGKHEEAAARFRALCPPWVFEPATDEELGFREDGGDAAESEELRLLREVERLHAELRAWDGPAATLRARHEAYEAAWEALADFREGSAGNQRLEERR